MTAGLVVLVCKGLEDVYLIGDPQTTFFKAIYRRFTNFSMEPVFQNFDQDVISLGQKVTCTLSRDGDLCNWIYLAVEIPPIPEYISNNCVDPIKKFAWARKLGFVLIKYAEIEIGGHEIDRQYGEWMNIWAEMTYTQNRGLDNMIGNIPEIYNFDNGKDSYLLYIPLFFWFCRHPNYSLPLVSMHYNDVKIHVQFNDAENCFVLGPTSSIKLIDDVVHFEKFEVVYQTLNGHLVYGLFLSFDPVTRTMYYIEINDTSQLYFMGLDTSSGQTSSLTPEQINQLRQDFIITGATSGYTAIPQDNSVEQSIQTGLPPPLSDEITFLSCQLDCLYIYLDSDERARFTTIPHEYVIEQVQFIPDKKFNTFVMSQKMGLNHPCKEFFWIIQYSYMYNTLNDWFNYTDKPYRIKIPNLAERNNIKNSKNSTCQTSPNAQLTQQNLDQINDPSLVGYGSFYSNNEYFAGKSLLDSSTIYLNSQKRMKTRNVKYYNYVQPYQHHTQGPPKGVNIYSYSLFPENGQHSGSCNMSRINDILLKSKLNLDVDLAFTVTQRAYVVNQNVLRILGGLAGMLFNN